MNYTSEIELYVRLAEHHGNLYDAYGDEKDLDLAVHYEKTAFQLRDNRPEAA